MAERPSRPYAAKRYAERITSSGVSRRMGIGRVHVQRSFTAFAVLALIIVSVLATPRTAAAGGGNTGLQSLTLVGSGGFTTAAEGTGDPSTDEFAPEASVDQLVPATGTSAARVPAAHVP